MTSRAEGENVIGQMGVALEVSPFSAAITSD